MAEDINQLLKVRREKLQNLQEAGKDPFKITKCDVTHHSMEIKNNYDELEGKTVTRWQDSARARTITSPSRFRFRCWWQRRRRSCGGPAGCGWARVSSATRIS